MLWINIKRCDKSGIYVPKSIARKIPGNVKLQFGLKSIYVNVKEIEDEYIKDENTFDNPINIEFSENVIGKLYIKENLVYQMIYNEKEKVLNIGPVIGFLLGEQSYYYKDTIQDIKLNNDIYSKLGGLFIAFKDISIDWKNKLISGMYYERNTGTWEYAILPMPSVIFRRAFYTSEKVIDRLKKLTGGKVFNSKRFEKLEMYKILEKEISFKKYLPETEEVKDEEVFHRFIEKYNKIILKPIGSSRGRGICFIHSVRGNFGVYDYRLPKEPRFYIISNNKIDEYIKNNFTNNKYLIQPQLQLATINGAPFDIRIVMGKNEDESWECRGIECRKAGSKDKITNISRGGQALDISSAIKLAFGPSVDNKKIKDDLISISKEFCTILDKCGEHFAEFGLDFAIDPNKNYWFIEANVRPAFKGFRYMDYKNYMYIKQMPIYYAAHISGFGRRIKDL